MAASALPYGKFDTSTAAATRTLQQLRNQQAQPVVVLLRDTAANVLAPEINPQLLARYHLLKQDLVSKLNRTTLQMSRDYSHLPMLKLQVGDEIALHLLDQLAQVLAIYPEQEFYTQLTQSLPLISAPKVWSMGFTGQHTTVAILDTGVNYTFNAFGNCTAPGIPQGCRVVAALDIAPNDGQLDDSGHGTNVSGIVAGVAPGAGLAVLDIFNGATAVTSDVLAGINWAIANQVAYNIVAINLSLGDGGNYTTPCNSSVTNPFVVPFANANAAGIAVVVANGNNGYSAGINLPACTPGAISVGAVYDANVGPQSYSNCTDASTTADQVTCFSNSAGYHTLWAPGAVITAANYSASGTSQATPHVAGTVALLRSAYPSENLSSLQARLLQSRKLITDARNGTIKPRLDVLDAVGAVNNPFSAALVLLGSSGNVSGITLGATKEPLEPNHAGVAGGASIWYRWTATQTGWVTMNTNGSSFDTVLAVYTGTALGNLSLTAADNNGGATAGSSLVTFYAQAGQTYFIAIDGVNAASGEVALQWQQTIDSGAGIDTDIPFLPGWALALMLLLISSMTLVKRSE
ncbi:MAG: S8 family serine peptidase [Gammaproteobacteria bacterium]|nr:S8 family serine peptidase [Gammaproteobacteria bacterium]